MTATPAEWRQMIDDAVAAERRFRRRVWTAIRAVAAAQVLLAACVLVHVLSHH